jgi:uncharacterized protein (TIGR02594 family)
MTQPRWLELAWGDLGVAETPGSNHTARVVAYYAQVGHPQIKDDETAWCAAFLGACLEGAGIPSTRSLMARSYLDWGDPAPGPRWGAVAVLSRTSDPALGHVGFLVGSTATSVVLLGGNQGNAVTVEAFPRARLLGLRWPSSASATTPAQPPSPVQPVSPVQPPTPVIPEAEPRPPAAGEAIRDPAAGDALFAHALAHVLEMEGGWSDDPVDPGGPTNFGITLATYARDKGVALGAGNLAGLTAELKTIPQATVRRIYRQRYWQPACCAQLTPALALFHFDASVNQGVTGAARMLQQAVGAAIDGEIGPETLAKAAAQPAAVTLARYADIRRAHYRSLSTFWRFGKGWLTRVDRTLAAATALLASAPPPPQPKETPTMTDRTQPAPVPVPAPVPANGNGAKWWGSSMTIWGVIVTGLSTVLPVIGPLFGLNVTADLVQQLGDQVVLVAQAVGGLAGTIMAIYGRTRATTSLERKQLTINL